MCPGARFGAAFDDLTISSMPFFYIRIGHMGPSFAWPHLVHLAEKSYNLVLTWPGQLHLITEAKSTI
jgi:hypothetical protein